jgi:hypothetical protein
MTNAGIIRQNGLRRINGSTGRYTKASYASGALRHTKGLWRKAMQSAQVTKEVQA